jgi:hypothetical protein
MSLRISLIALCLLGAPGFAAQPTNPPRSLDKPKSTKGEQLLSQRLTPESRELARLIAIARRQVDTGKVHNHTLPMTGGAAFVWRIAHRGNSDVVKDAMESVRNSTFTQRGVPSGCNLLTLHYEALAVQYHDGENPGKWFAPRITKLLKTQHPSGPFNPQFDKLWIYPIEKAVALSSLACLIPETLWRYHLNK